MKKLLKRAAAVAVMIATTFIGVAFTGEAALAASCTSAVTWFNTSGTTYMQAPSLNGSTYCTLGNGNQSEAVRVLQRSLNYCYGAGLATDGIYGSRTATAVRTAQREAGIAQDGVYGRQTLNAMLHAYYSYRDKSFFTCGYKAGGAP